MNKNCAVYSTSNLIGKRWTILLILELYKGHNHWKRYNVIKSRIPGITSKMLAARLRELEKEGLVIKQVDSTVMPVKSEYSLTKKGEEFIKIIEHIKTWSIKHSTAKFTCKARNCKSCQE